MSENFKDIIDSFVLVILSVSLFLMIRFRRREEVRVIYGQTETEKDLQRFKLAVENASDHIIITDKEGFIVYANKSVERITGFSNNEIIGKKAGSKDLWGGLMGKSFYDGMWDIIKNKKEPFYGEIKNRRKDGSEYYAYLSVSPVLDKRGEVQFFVGIERYDKRKRD